MPEQMNKSARTTNNNQWGLKMKDYLMKIATKEADVSIEPRNDIDTILLSIVDDHSRNDIALTAHQAEKLAAMLNIAAGIARGK